MKAFLLGVLVFALLALGAPAAALAQSVDNLPTRDYCRDSPFPVLCLIVRAGYQPAKWCPEVIGQTSYKPAGQQCESDAREPRSVPAPMSREPDPHECHGYEKSKAK